jgi:hypothetical protein
MPCHPNHTAEFPLPLGFKSNSSSFSWFIFACRSSCHPLLPAEAEGSLQTKADVINEERFFWGGDDTTVAWFAYGCHFGMPSPDGAVLLAATNGVRSRVASRPLSPHVFTMY